MSKQKQASVRAKLKLKGGLYTVTWPGGGRAKVAAEASTERVYGVLTSRTNKLTGESTTFAILAATERSIVGATLTIGTRTYKITAVRELRPNDVLVMQEADLA